MSLATLTTAISSRLQKLSELCRTHRAPAGYRPGVTLEYLRRNLRLASFAATGPAQAVFFLGDDALQVDVCERTESQLLMHLVMTQFSIRIPAAQAGSVCLDLHHSGALRRTGLSCRQRAKEPALWLSLKARLQADHALYQALMALDFKRLQCRRQGQEWHVRLEHMGGSEVVNRMPAFRRYIALSDVQRAALLTVLAGLQRTLRAL